ncbi:MAG: O-antigen ligase family protein [Myxococcales bacterium]
MRAEVALGLLVLFCPLAIGTVHLWAIAVALVLSLVACGLAAWATVRSGEPFLMPWPAWAFVAATGFIGLQLVPLPPALLGLIAPRTHELFDFVLAPLGHYPAWRPLSLDPPATARELARAITCLAAFLATAQIVRSHRSRTRVLTVVGVAGLAVALIGFAHALWNTTTLFGVFDYTHARPPFLSTFGNPNHLASFLGLGATALLARVLTERDRKIATLWAFGYFAAGVGVLLTLSRAGIVGFVGSQIMLGVGVHLARRSEREDTPVRAGRLVVPAAILGVLAVAAYLAWDALARELATADSLEKVKDSKIAFWPSFVPLVRAHWLTGVGRGAFEAAFQRFQPAPLAVTLTHPENLVFQWSAELGVPMALLLLGACGGSLVLAIKRNAGDVERLAAAIGVAGVALHDLVDFGLELGGLAVPASVAFAIAVARRSEGPRFKRRGALALVPVAGVVGVVGLFGASGSLARDGEALAGKLGKAPAAEIAADAGRLARRHPADYFPHLVAAQAFAAETPLRADALLAFANRAMYLNRAQAQPHRLAAFALRSLGRHDQARVEYRLAAERGDRTVIPEVVELYERAEQLLEAVPDDEASLAALADALIAQRRIEAAETVVRTSLERHGESLQTLQRLARVASARLEPDEAYRVGARMTEIAPDKPLGLHTRVRALQMKGEPEAAMRLLEEEGFKRHPMDPEIALSLATMKLAARDTRGCREALERLPPGLDLRVRLRALRLEASAAERDGQRARAVSLMRTAVTLRPDDAGLRWQYARLLERAGRYDLAIREADAAAARARNLREEADKLKVRAEAKLREIEDQRRWRSLVDGR